MKLGFFYLLFFSIIFFLVGDVKANVIPPPYCDCTFTIKKKVLQLTGKEAPAASGGPSFGYADPKDHCALAFSQFGNLVATDSGADGKMCGGYCSTVLGLGCPKNKSCHNDKDCGKEFGTVGDNLLCEQGQCVVGVCANDDPVCTTVHKANYDVDSDKNILTAGKCNEILTGDPSTVWSTGYSGQKPCGGLCAAYYGKTCPNEQKCKLNQDCQSKNCEFKDASSEFGYCQEKTDPDAASPDHSDLAKYLESTKKFCFLPQQLSCSYPAVVSQSSCDQASKDDAFQLKSDPLVVEVKAVCSVGSCALNVDKVPQCSGPAPAATGAPTPVVAGPSNEDVANLAASQFNHIGTTDIKVVFGRAIRVAMGVMGSLALAMFVYAGFLMMLSPGNSENVEKGRTVLVWSSLGLVVILASYALVSLILTTF